MRPRCTSFLLVAGLLAGCTQPAGRARRVILITCDTLRADHLGAYGYARATSPRLDQFAREAVVFDEAFSSAPWTGPALASLHTGLLPDEIGVPGGNRFPLPAECETLAERVRDAGHATGAVVSNWVLRRPPAALGDAGLPQGFREYDDRMQAREQNRDLHERLAPDTTDAALAWLESQRARGDDRFFFWVHYQDPHGPYLPPAAALAAVQREATGEPELPLGTTVKGKGQIPSYQVVDGERRPEPYRARYDGEIRFFDEHLGRLFDWLRANSWWEDSLIVFTADHGESLGEGGYWFCHGENVRREVVRVPLIVRYPHGAPRPPSARVGQLASHLDLWPTVLEALGLEPQPNRGLSLFAAELPSQRVSVQTMGFAGRPNRWLAASDGRFRLVRAGTGAPQLFDGLADPGETQDLAAKLPNDVRRLGESAQAWMRLHARRPVQPQALPDDAATNRALHGLGYAGGEESDEHGK